MSKFSEGEVCLAKSMVGRFEGWREFTIVVGPMSFDEYEEYTNYQHWFTGPCDSSDAPFYILDSGRCAMESQLRKRRPPQTDTQTADEDFIKDLRGMIFKDEVEA